MNQRKVTQLTGFYMMRTLIVNPFNLIRTFLYSMKISENQRFFDVSKTWKQNSGMKWVNALIYIPLSKQENIQFA